MSEIYQAFSPYNYTLNNPIKFVDPNGMWVENAESYSTNDPDEIREFFRSSQRSNEESSNQNINQEITEGDCCPGNGNKRGPSGGSDDSRSVDFMNSPFVGLAVRALEETSADVLRGTNPLSQLSQTSKNLRVVNGSAGVLGKAFYLTGLISIRLDYKNPTISTERFSYNTMVTILPWAIEGGAAAYSAATGAAAFGSTPVGWAAAGVGIVGILGGQVYDGVSWWIYEVSKGLDSFVHEINNGVNPNYMIPSDSLLKSNIIKLENPLQKVLALNGYSYRWKMEDYSQSNLESGWDIGLIAQEVEIYFPELVAKDDNGKKLIAYYKLIPVLIEALKEQHKILNQQKKLIDNQLRTAEYKDKVIFEVLQRLEKLEQNE